MNIHKEMELRLEILSLMDLILLYILMWSLNLVITMLFSHTILIMPVIMMEH